MRTTAVAVMLLVVVDVAAGQLPRVTAQRLYADYIEAPGGLNDADKIYAHRVFVVTGRISAIGRVPARSDRLFKFPDFGACQRRSCGGYVTLDGKVQALFHPDDDQEIAPLRRGQTVAIACAIQGANTAATHILGTECTVVPPIKGNQS